VSILINIFCLPYYFLFNETYKKNINLELDDSNYATMLAQLNYFKEKFVPAFVSKTIFSSFWFKKSLSQLSTFLVYILRDCKK